MMDAATVRSSRRAGSAGRSSGRSRPRPPRLRPARRRRFVMPQILIRNMSPIMADNPLGLQPLQPAEFDSRPALPPVDETRRQLLHWGRRAMKSNTVYPKIPTRLYGTTVVSLAVFFTGLIVWRVPVDGYLAVSEVGRRILAQPDSQDQLTAVADDRRTTRRSRPSTKRWRMPSDLLMPDLLAPSRSQGGGQRRTDSQYAQPTDDRHS